MVHMRKRLLMIVSWIALYVQNIFNIYDLLTSLVGMVGLREMLI